MNNCTVCDDGFRNDNPNKIICDGICRQVFHAECVNFNNDALLQYRQIPNLQWFCDNCIIQVRSPTSSSNVSSHLFSKLNSTVVVPTSSPFYVQRSLPAANPKRKPRPSAKPTTSSVSLVNKSPTVKSNIKKANDLISLPPFKNVIGPVHKSLNSPCTNGSHPITTPVTNQSDVDQPKPKCDTENFEETLTEPSENPSANSSSFAEVLTKSSIAEKVSARVKGSPFEPEKDLFRLQSIASKIETHKIAYVSNLHPSVTEEEIVNYLLLNNVISSTEDVSCKKLVARNVDLDTVSFVSFKVTVRSDLFHAVVNSKLWPDRVVVREFVNR